VFATRINATAETLEVCVQSRPPLREDIFDRFPVIDLQALAPGHFEFMRVKTKLV
jgi:hypothetical protein